jgi:hypothetical protein
MITTSINVTKIDKSAIKEHKSGGKYLALTLMENKNGTDQYGNDGYVVQDIGKARREAGERGPIIGNWKNVGGFTKRPTVPQQPAPAAKSSWDDEVDSEIPF